MTDFKNSPSITLAMLRKIATVMSPKQLATLPPEKLPSQIPTEILDSLPEANKQVIEDLMFQKEVHRMSDQIDEIGVLGKEVSEALEKAERAQPPVSFARFHEDVQKLQRSYVKARKDNSFNITKFVAALRSLAPRYDDIRRDCLTLSYAADILKKSLGTAPSATKRLTDAIVTLRNKLDPAVLAIGKHNQVRLRIINHEMSALQRNIAKQEKSTQRIDAEIYSLRKELKKMSGGFNILRGGEHVGNLKQQISDLIVEKKSTEVPVAEKDLQRWLDAIVDISLDPQRDSKTSKYIHEVRMSLYLLLNKYCEQQEQSALQIAENPFSHVDAKQAMDFMLISERFVLNYFSYKKNEKTLWISGTVDEKKKTLEALQKDLLKEMRRNIKTLNRQQMVHRFIGRKKS